MISGIASNNSNFEVYPADWYKLRLNNILEEEKRIEFQRDGEDAYQWRWSWEILAGPYAGKSLTTWTSRYLSRAAKARMWIEGMLGRELSDREEVQLDSFIGTEVKAMLMDTSLKTGKPKNDIAKLQRADVTETGQQTGAETLGSDKPTDDKQSLGLPRRHLVALRQVQDQHAGGDQQYYQAQVLGAERAGIPFLKLTPEEQRLLVETYEGWARGDDVPM